MMPSWKQFLNEGILTNYRNEKEGRKLTANDFKNSFEVILCKLITERIPNNEHCVLCCSVRDGIIDRHSQRVFISVL